jgi:polygalacturonase
MVINSYTPPELQVNLDNVRFSNVPYSVRLSGRTQGRSGKEAQMDFEAPAPIYLMKSFSHGMLLENTVGNPVTRNFTTTKEQLPLESLGEFTPKDVPALPSQKTWVNISDLGAKGDGTTDCTAIFEKAIAKYDAIYIPMGKYSISKTLTLRDQTSLIGLHPSMTQLVLKDGTPEFMDADNCKPLLVTPENGSNIITGIGFDFGTNPGVIGIKWMAGIHSYFNDGLFRGRGNVRGEGQTYSIWVTKGGGGTFKNFWSPDSRAKCALFVSNTKTPGKIYEISIEHHRDIELKLENVENWAFYALQLEEDKGSEKALGIYMKDCRNILFANLRSHRTTGVWDPFYAAIIIRNSRDITIQGSVLGGAVFPWDNAVFDEITGMVIPQLYFTKLVIK